MDGWNFFRMSSKRNGDLSPMDMGMPGSSSINDPSTSGLFGQAGNSATKTKAGRKKQLTV
ncbi:hypothetical protein M3Y97_00904400 [Aphelenchoides bicaudatus]|nr:hypothetical protein M3Y97_00904400 [Aphelenchoides bicaudatus]